MAWQQTSDEPLSEPMMAKVADEYISHSASMSKQQSIYFCISSTRPIWIIDLMLELIKSEKQKAAQ